MCVNLHHLILGSAICSMCVKVDQLKSDGLWQDTGSKRRQTSSVNNGSANGNQAASVEVPVEDQEPMGQEQDMDGGGEEQPLMSTQDYLAEAEELLAVPMDTQGTQVLYCAPVRCRDS